MRTPEETPGHIKITIIHEATVLGQNTLPVRFVPCRYLVPWHHRLLVMGGVQIIIEEKQSKERGVFDNGRSFGNTFARPMLCE